MAERQWGNTDNASNSVFWGVVSGKVRANSVNQTAFFGNVTPDAYITGLTMGQFGVDAANEMQVAAGPVNLVTITSPGTGYNGTTLSTISGGGGSGANVTFSSTVGKLTGYTIVNGGSSYETNPTITVQAPTKQAFYANAAVTAGTGGGANSVIALATAGNFAANDTITYSVSAGNTALSGLTSGTTYYVQFANATHVALSETLAGSRITLTKGLTQNGHFLQGTTATAATVTGGALHKGVAHAGWVVRKVGSGGRAGRVQYETLVAMGSITGDSEDVVLPDS